MEDGGELLCLWLDVADMMQMCVLEMIRVLK
jgi:hypothetical protein